MRCVMPAPRMTDDVRSRALYVNGLGFRIDPEDRIEVIEGVRMMHIADPDGNHVRFVSWFKDGRPAEGGGV
jgi:hypothetical protein